jgi:hypothetical protein
MAVNPGGIVNKAEGMRFLGIAFEW